MNSLARRAAWVRVLPFALFIALLALRGQAQSWLPAEWDPRWIYAVQTALVAALLLALRRDYGELVRQLVPTARQAITAVAVGLVVFVLWITLDAPWMVLGQASASFAPVDAQGNVDWALVAFRVAGAALVVPVMEELFWRSFVMRWVDDPLFERVAPGAVSMKAVIVSTFLFVLAHTQWLAAAVAGLAYALLYMRTGRLWTAIVAHAVTNAALAVWVLATRQWQYW
jgi:CAAX prenyl protease-like protein